MVEARVPARRRGRYGREPTARQAPGKGAAAPRPGAPWSDAGARAISRASFLQAHGPTHPVSERIPQMTAGNREPRAPALVLGTGQTALGVVRILGRAGIPLYVTSSDRGPIRWSRWCRAAPRTHPGDRPDDLPAYLEALGLDAGVLIPCSDDSARAVACLPPELGARFPASLSTPDTLASFTDKGRLSALLERYGVPHPRTVVVDGALDARDALGERPSQQPARPDH